MNIEHSNKHVRSSLSQTWYRIIIARCCGSKAVKALLLMIIFNLLSIGHASAGDRRFNLIIKNGLTVSQGFNLIARSCYQGEGGSLNIQPLAPGASKTVTIAKDQDNGCGQNGYFELQPHGYLSSTPFVFDDDRRLSHGALPTQYYGVLSEQSLVDGSYTWTILPNEQRLKLPIDQRLSRPRNPITAHIGKWGHQDGTTLKQERFTFQSDGFSGNYYEDCFNYPLFHAQHVQRLADQDGKAYFMITQSRGHNGNMYLIETFPGVLNESTGKLNLQPEGSFSGKIIWEEVFTGDYNGILNPIGNWNHPGKMSVIDGVLTVAAQNWSEGKFIDTCTGSTSNSYERGDSEDAVLFFDVRDPSAPQYWGKMTATELQIPQSDYGNEHGDFQLGTRMISVVSLWRTAEGKYAMNAGGEREGSNYATWETDAISPNIRDWVKRPNIEYTSGEYGDDFESYQATTSSNAMLRNFSFNVEDTGPGRGEKDGFRFLAIASEVNNPLDVQFNLGLDDDETWIAASHHATRKGVPLIYTAVNSPGPSPQILQVYDTRNILELTHPARVVSNVNDSGPGSLREAIGYGGTITFDPKLSGKTLRLSSGALVVSLYDVDIDGSSLLKGFTISGSYIDRVLHVTEGINVKIKGLTLRDGLAQTQALPQGINNNHTSLGGGGILNQGTLVLDQSTVVQNFSESYGGGIVNLGSMTVVNSTITRNDAGVRIDNFAFSLSGTGGGGGIANFKDFHLIHSTVANNVDYGTDLPNPASGIASYGIGLIIENSIIVSRNAITRGNLYGIYNTAGANIINGDKGSVLFTGPIPILALDFELEDEADYGGLTRTMPPIGVNSPAIDSAIFTGNTHLTGTKDQRGLSRLSGGAYDIGAVEIQQNSIDGLSYEVVEAQNTASAMVLGRSSGSENTVIVIPDNVTINGITYPVTSVAPNAFENSPITSVTIGSNVTIISGLAFCGSPTLTSVTIPDKMVRIDKNAFCDVESVKFLGDYSTGFSPDAFNPTAGFTIEACFDSPSWNGVSFRTDQADVMVSPCDNSVVRKDINGDGKADILWRNHADGRNALWTMDGMSIADISLIYKVDDQNWKIVGRGDFNGDKKSDILWRNNLTGLNYIWMMDGFTVSARQAINTVANLDWQIKAVADFNGDNKSDILWHQQKTGRTHIYLMDGFQIMARSSVRFVDDLNWQIAAAADVNADGKSDVIWRNQRTGLNYIWLMDGYTLEQGYVTNTVDGAWDIVGAGDLNGDGHGDIVWRNQIDGRNWAHLMKDGKVQTSQLINIVIEQDWQITDVLDLDGDGSDDLFWRNISSGSSYIYLMDGIVIKDRGFSNTVDTDWQNIH